MGKALFRVAEVGIHEAGEKQAGAQGFGENITRSSDRNFWQAEAIRRESAEEFRQRLKTFAEGFPLGIRAHPSNGLLQSITIPRRHSGVMPVHSESAAVTA